MPDSPLAAEDLIFAIDVGATSIKYAHVDATGRIVGEVERELTPFPCTPSILVAHLLGHVRASGCRRAGVGFPGDMIDGRVIEPGNLSRAGGILTDIDPAIHAQWLNFELARALNVDATIDVRVVNDATLAAYGYSTGVGRELVFTLGTGFGIALMVNGEWQKIRDVGLAPYRDVGTYDEVFGEPSRAADPAQWLARLRDAARGFVEEFAADSVHIGGGNARHLRVSDFADLGVPVELNDNQGTLRGAASLFAAGR